MDIMNTATDRDLTIAAIKAALKNRSGKAWSVKGCRGTALGWIRISAPPARCDQFGCMTADDISTLSTLLGTDVHQQGANVPASSAYRREYLQRASGQPVTECAQPYWD